MENCGRNIEDFFDKKFAEVEETTPTAVENGSKVVVEAIAVEKNHIETNPTMMAENGGISPPNSKKKMRKEEVE